MTPLPHSLSRTVLIRAELDTVFRFFTDSARWAAWWGSGSSIDARPGGALKIRYPNGVEAVGEVLELVPPRRFVFTYGFVNGDPIPPGASRVLIELGRDPEGTRLNLRHDFAEAGVRDQFVQGWRYQLSLFGNVVANEVSAGAAGAIDQWLGLWADSDASSRARTLQAIATPGVRFRDRFSLIDGADELVAHIAGAQRFMPGVSLAREGDVRHCQGTVLANWKAVGPDGQIRGRGMNVFVMAANGRFETVTGFWE